MSTATKAHTVSAMDIDSRVDAYSWSSISEHLDAHGWAMFEKLLTASECETIAGLYADDGRFRSHVVAGDARHLRGEPAARCEPAAVRSSAHRRRDLPRRGMNAAAIASI